MGRWKDSHSAASRNSRQRRPQGPRPKPGGLDDRIAPEHHVVELVDGGPSLFSFTRRAARWNRCAEARCRANTVLLRRKTRSPKSLLFGQQQTVFTHARAQSASVSVAPTRHRTCRRRWNSVRQAVATASASAASTHSSTSQRTPASRRRGLRRPNSWAKAAPPGCRRKIRRGWSAMIVSAAGQLPKLAQHDLHRQTRSPDHGLGHPDAGRLISISPMRCWTRFLPQDPWDYQ